MAGALGTGRGEVVRHQVLGGCVRVVRRGCQEIVRGVLLDVGLDGRGEGGAQVQASLAEVKAHRKGLGWGDAAVFLLGGGAHRGYMGGAGREGWSRFCGRWGAVVTCNTNKTG